MLWRALGCGWLLAALALLGASCAPGERPTQAKATEELTAPAEPILHAPKPAPSGPRYRIEAAIENVRQRDMLVTHGFWTIFHGILGLGPSVTLRDPLTQEKVNALDYITQGRELRGMRFIPTKHGLDVEIGPLMVGQGHQDQFVAEMAQWGMPGDRQFLVYGREYSFMDFVRHSQMRARVNANQELGWTILVIGQYLGTDVSWTNEHGEPLRFEQLVQYEVDAPIEKLPCGGTHSLFGLTWVYHLHLSKGGQETGVWKAAAEKLAKHRDLARKYQNGDGLFSTSFFGGPALAADPQLRINTTGHTLEWLALYLSDKEIREPWVELAAAALAQQLLDLQSSGIESGSLYHAVHGLLLYYARIYDADKLGPCKPVFPPRTPKSLRASAQN
jgi:hypothetical protein